MFLQDNDEELRHNLRCLYCFLLYGDDKTIKAIHEKFNLRKIDFYDTMPLLSFLLQDKYNSIKFEPDHLLQFFEVFIPSLNVISADLSNTAFNFELEQKEREKARKKIGILISKIIDYIFENGYLFVFKDCNKGMVIKADNEVKVVYLNDLISAKTIKTKQYYISELSKNDEKYLVIKDKSNGEQCKFKVRLKGIKKFDSFCPIKTIARYKQIQRIIEEAIKPHYKCPLCLSETFKRNRCCVNCDEILAKLVQISGRKRSIYYDVVVKTKANDENNKEETKKLRKDKLLNKVKELKKDPKCNKNVEIFQELEKAIGRAFS